MKFIFTVFSKIALAIVAFAIVLPAQAQSGRAITQIEGDLYRFQNKFHYSVFLVTPEGVIATDPINADAANWLKKEIESRFRQKVKYVIYSHHHADHVSGGEVFASDGAVVIAHENAVAGLKQDNVATAMPHITFSDEMTVELGGEKVELSYVGKSHSDNMIVAHFPKQRTLFTVDFITAKRLPYRNISRSYFPDYFDAFDKVAAMNFDILAPGHGAVGVKQDAIDHATYMRELYDAVKAGKQAGKTVEELQASVTMDKYKDWGQYDAWRTENIQGMYGHVSN